MKKIFKILGRTLVFLIVFLLLVNVFDFVGITKIKVVDSITNEPLSGIQLSQNIIGTVSRGPGGSDSYPIRVMSGVTDSSGIMKFPMKLHVHNPIIKWFRGESMAVNQHGKELYFNNDYYPTSVEFGIKHLLPYKTKTVKLTPYVDDISKCNNNKDCISHNSLYLAFTKEDELYCKNLYTDTTSRYDGGAFLRGECYSIIALSKKDISLCKNVPESAYRGKARCLNYINEEGEWGQEVCDQFFHMDNRTFIACDSLLEKYGCRAASENCGAYYEYFDPNTGERIN